MIENERQSVENIVSEYKETVEELCKFLPWLERRSAGEVMSIYDPNRESSFTMGIPIYDGTLLRFVKYLETTKFMNKNYEYVYRRNGMRDSKDELRMIQRVGIQQIDVLGAILSKYTLKGKVKGVVWKEGMDNGVFLATVKKLKELIEFWDMPIINQ